ncbi:MAG: hypothetical protein WCY76_09045 [Leucobacter sp.]
MDLARHAKQQQQQGAVSQQQEQQQHNYRLVFKPAKGKPASQREVVLRILNDRPKERGADLGGLDAEAVAERMLAALPSPKLSEWDDLIGPFYTNPALNEWRKVTRQRHHALKQKGRLLAVRTSVGETLYPSFQFSASGELLPDLPKVLEVLSEADFDEWMIALWFNSALPQHGDRTPADLLREGRIDVVLELARTDVELRSRG